jgi:hypothetical protein
MENADAVVLHTEWNAFRNIDLARARSLLHRPVMIDLRNVYDPREMIAAGFSYTSIGRPAAANAHESAGSHESANGQEPVEAHESAKAHESAEVYGSVEARDPESATA